MSGRAAILNELLVVSRPINKIIHDLAQFGWDSDKELVTLRRDHVASILSEYLAGRCSASDVRIWAETIEGRDDIGIEQPFFASLQEIIFQLANPELGYELSALRARNFIGQLAE